VSEKYKGEKLAFQPNPDEYFKTLSELNDFRINGGYYRFHSDQEDGTNIEIQLHDINDVQSDYPSITVFARCKFKQIAAV